MAENACRHFLGMFPDPRPSCAMGRNGLFAVMAVVIWGLACVYPAHVSPIMLISHCLTVQNWIAEQTQKFRKNATPYVDK